MKQFWYKAKKEFTLGVDSAKGIFGVKSVSHDLEVQEKAEILSQIEKNVKQLLLSFQYYLSSTNKLISSSSAACESLTNSFQPSDGNYYQNSLQIRDLLQKYSQINEEMTKNHVPNNCITPLIEFQQHIRSLNVILEKSKKNKILLEAAVKNEQECAKRQKKMDYYQAAFCQGVDILRKKQAAVFDGVFNAHQYDMKSLVTDVKTRLPPQIMEFSAHHLETQLPSIESVLEVPVNE